MPARFADTVKTSDKYMLIGSSVFSPSLNATSGLVGVAITSHFAKALSKSCRSSVRTCWAFL